MPTARPSTGPAGLLGALALAGGTYALIEAGAGTVAVTVAVVVGIVGTVAFVLRERSAPYPVLPFRVFSSVQFSATNAVTFLAYGGLGVVFFLLVVQLQVATGFGPVAAGSALLPVTAIMLLLSSRSGALASRIGPRLQMATGPLLAAVGVLLLAGVGPGDDYLRDVLPGVLVFGFGLAVMVAPLTATALAAAPAEHAGMASGVNNAVARTGGLAAVAAVPVLAGVGDDFADGYRTALWISAGVLAAAGALAALTIRNDVLEDEPTPAAATTSHLSHCGVGAPPLASACDDAGRPCSGRVADQDQRPPRVA